MNARMDMIECQGLVFHRWFARETLGMDETLWSELNSQQRVVFEKIDRDLRSREWCTARRGEIALAKEFEKNGASMRSQSVAHCPKGVIVVASSQVHGLGVDIEASDRSLTPLILNRIRSARESELVLKDLEWWTTKEALYKSFADNHDRHLSEFVVTRFEQDTRQGQAAIDGQILNFCLGHIDEFLTCVAWNL